MILATLLSLFSHGAIDSLPWTLELHPVGLAATLVTQFDPWEKRTSTKEQITRWWLYEASGSWRFDSTASLVASVSTWPSGHYESTGLLDGKPLWKTQADLWDIGLNIGVRRHRPSLRGLVLDIDLTTHYRSIDRSIGDWPEVVSGSGWGIGFLVKPGVQWTWRRWTARLSAGGGLEWAQGIEDKTVAIFDVGPKRRDRIGLASGLADWDSGLNPQGEGEFAIGYRF